MKRVKRDQGTGIPNWTEPPRRFRRPESNWKKRSDELKNVRDPLIRLPRSAGSE